MNTRRINLTLATWLAAILAASAFAAEQTGKAQTLCPVKGGKIDTEVYTDYQGQRVYFCCPGCVGTFKKTPDKYLKKLADEGVVLKSVQTKCPVMGRKIDKKIYTDYKGRRVYFCCQGCVKAFKKNPEKYLKRLDEPQQQKSRGSHHK